MRVEFRDILTLDAPRRTGDGYLVASVKAARAGIQKYRGSEVDPDNEHGMRDQAIVNVYRPADEVFHRDSLHSYAHRPVTIDHPPEAVTADNWRQYAVGMVGDEIARDGDFVRVPMVVMDAAAISVIETGKREISQGYTCDLDWTAGKTSDGLEYDAVQRNIRANHTAVVGLARGGPELKIGDSQMPKMVTVDGHSVELNDAAAIAVAGLQTKLADALTAIGTHAKDAATWATEKATLDAKVATLEAETKKLKDAQPTAESLDKLVTDRAALIADAKLIAGDDLDVTGDAAAIRKRAVTKVLGDGYAAKDQAFFDAAFEIQRDQAKAKAGNGDAMADALASRIPAQTGTADRPKMVVDAREAMIARLANGGRDPADKSAAH